MINPQNNLDIFTEDNSLSLSLIPNIDNQVIVNSTSNGLQLSRATYLGSNNDDETVAMEI